MNTRLPCGLEERMKTCSKCGETKPVDEFSKKASNRDGMQSNCKSCTSIYAAAWYANNRERRNASIAKWRAANPEKVKAANDAWYASNTEWHKSVGYAWRAANTEKVRSDAAKWAAANKENVKEYGAKWAAANQDAKRIYRQNRRARKLESGGQLSKGLSDKLFKLQRGKCACGCKQPLGDDYHMDHVMPLALGGTNTDDNMQLLTAKCNLQKGTKHPVDFMQQRGLLL